MAASILILGYVVLHAVYGIGGDLMGFPYGVIPRVLTETGDQLNILGTVTGFPAVSRPIGQVNVVRARQDPTRLGGIEMTIILFIGSNGGIDMERTGVQWTDSAGTETISMVSSPQVICPNWTILRKLNMNPFRTADEDTILEPGESFDVFVCPTRPLSPYNTFTVIFKPPGAGLQFPVKRTVPAPVIPVMQLG